MTAFELKVQGVRMRQTPGSWFWGGEIICWVSYQWVCCPICVLQASSRRRDSLEFRHGRDRRVLREVHDGCRRLARPRRVVLGASYGESFPRCPGDLLQACILKRARATTCGDKPAPWFCRCPDVFAASAAWPCGMAIQNESIIYIYIYI